MDDTSWFWTDEWQAKERKVDSDFQNGKYTVCQSTDEVVTLFRDKDGA